MKPTAFSVHVTSFLTHYLAAQRNVSPNTIKAYRDVFTLLLRFCRDAQGIALERLRLEQIDVSLVEAFLDYLEHERKSSPRTRNQRLAALHAFFRYLQAEAPDRMQQCQKILAIPLRKHARPTVNYLSKEELAAILAHPDLRTPEGRRDAVLLSVLYDTGARVQELVDLSVGDVRLDPPAQLRVLGKGRKMRAVPLMGNTVQLLRSHMQENQLDRPEQFDKPLFHNARHERLTRSGIRYILHKYVVLARNTCPSLNRTVSPHTVRHTKGMHLLQSGVSLDMIRDFLGHVDAKTTQIYARANLEMKRKALEKISEPSSVQTIPCWQQNKDLLDWLHSL
jgi:integrase/recombinase XerD